MDPYAVLDVAPTASNAEIVAAYKSLALLHHPDKRIGTPPPPDQSSSVEFRVIAEAYRTLTNPEKRARYDTKFGHNFGDRVSRALPNDTPIVLTRTAEPKKQTDHSGDSEFGEDDEEYVPERVAFPDRRLVRLMRSGTNSPWGLVLGSQLTVLRGTNGVPDGCRIVEVNGTAVSDVRDFLSHTASHTTIEVAVVVQPSKMDCERSL